MSAHKCPNCGERFKLKNIVTFNNPAAGRGWFDSAVPTLRWVFFGNGRAARPAESVYVKADLRTGDNQFRFGSGVAPVPLDKLRRLAMVYERGDGWTMATNCKVLSQSQHHKLKAYLLDLGLLTKKNSRSYYLNRGGRAFFRLCLRQKVGGQ